MERAVKRGADLQRERGTRGLTAEDIHTIYLSEGIASPGVAVIEERMTTASRLGLVRPAEPGDGLDGE